MDKSWTIQPNKYGIPVIKGESQLDAVEAIGYANAQERLIQMDYYRRFVTGSLSELYGVSTLPNDIEMIKYDFHTVACDVVKRLCTEDIQRLNAYCKGVNDFISEGKLPIEYEVLKYKPSNWTPESCVLVCIYTHYVLNYLSLQDEIMLTTLKKHLDEQLYYFYTPDKDRYSDFKIYGKEGKRTVTEFPKTQIEKLYREALKIKRNKEKKLNSFMNINCPVQISFEEEISYAIFRTGYIQRKLKLIFHLDKEEFRADLQIDSRNSTRIENMDETTEEIHIEGFLPEYLKSMFNFNAGFFEIKASADINLKTFTGTGKLELLKNEYFTYNHYDSPHGSNCMIVNGSLSQNGKTIIANDPHLPYAFPNLFYMLAVEYEEQYFQGFMVPGTPLMVAGNNKNICWGITSTASNFFDLVIVNQEHFSCEECEKKIKVKISKSKVIEETVHYYKNEYGPLLEYKVGGERVSIHWTASDANIYDFSFSKMVTASDTMEAIDIVQNAGCVPINILIGDTKNNIAWTIGGKVPKRVGIDGDSAEHWEKGTAFWDGYIEPKEKPIILNPKEGFIVNANDRTYGSEYPYMMGCDFANGWRTKRITDLLSATQDPISKDKLWEIMTDINCEPYDLYYQLIQSVVNDLNGHDKEELACLFLLLKDWNKQADKCSQSMLVINCFRDKILEKTLLPLYYIAGEYQSFFKYHWFKFDEVIMSLWYDQKFYSDEAAEFYGFKNRERFFISMLYDVKNDLTFLSELIKKDIKKLTWGDINQLNVNMQAVSFAGYGIFSQINKDKKLPRGPMSGSFMSVNAVFINSGPLYRFIIDLKQYRNITVNHLGGNYGSLLTGNKYTQTSNAWLNGEKIVSES